jgi:hypothetical protein
MAARTLLFPAQLLRWLVAPALVGAVLAAASLIRRRARQPSLPRMSDQWLQSLDRSAGRGTDSWR